MPVFTAFDSQTPSLSAYCGVVGCRPGHSNTSFPPNDFMRILLLTIAAGIALASPAAAQTVDDIPATRLVRVTYRPLENEGAAQVPKPVIGRFIARRADTLFIRTGTLDTARYAIHNLSNVEYSAGQGHPRLRATLIGFAGGAVAGAAYGYGRTSGAGISCLSGVSGICSSIRPTSKWRSAGQEGAIGAAVGLASGFITGTLITVQRWVAVHLD
jgi:hypothetical protein